jgi:coproporphyrinogen III oxidase-like Fe-S oxidoreductase
MSQLSLPPLSLYVHIPWCVRKCPYCDFNSHGLGRGLPFGAYVAAAGATSTRTCRWPGAAPCTACSSAAARPACSRRTASARSSTGASARLRFAPGCEVTLETNPGTAEHGRFEGYRAPASTASASACRVSTTAACSGSAASTTAAQAEAAVKLAQDAGFDNINLDLMYALPGQDLAMALATSSARSLQPAHLSHYQLTLEPNTVFAPGRRRPADDDEAWDIQEPARRGWPMPASRSTRFPPTRARAGSARTTSTTGASATTSASAPAPTASSACRHRAQSPT